MRTLTGLIVGMFWVSLAGQTASISDITHPEKTMENTIKAGKKVQISVRDMKTRERIPFFTVDFTSCGHPVYESNAEGLFSLETVDGFECYIRIAKRGYANLDLLVDHDEIPTEGKTFNIYLSRSPNSFSGHVRDTAGNNLYLAGAKIELRSTQNDHIQLVESNQQGEFSLYLTPETDYTLQIRHPDYLPFEHRFRTGSILDGHEIKRFYVNRIDHKKIPSGLGTEIGVVRKDQKLEGINYYSVQVLAKHSEEVDPGDFKELSKFGEVFVEKEGGVTKVKVGKFFDRAVAERTLTKIRFNTIYKDAFLSQYLAGNKYRQKSDRVIPTREEGYLVRLASYLNPEMFDGSKLENLGHVTSVQKNEWTIMLLAGFSRLDDAKEAAEKVRDLGFKSAHVVRYEGAALVKAE